jgi:hypothetical protein
VLEDTLTYLTNFQVFAVWHVRQVGNQAAHNLAKLALNHCVDKEWLEVCSSSIESIVLDEQFSS